MILAFFRQEHGESSASQVWEEDASLVFYLKDTLSFSVLSTTYIPPARNKSWSHQRAYYPAKPSSAGQMRLFPSSILVPRDLHQGMDQRRELVYSSTACCIHFLPYILVHQRIWNNSWGKKVWSISEYQHSYALALVKQKGIRLRQADVVQQETLPEGWAIWWFKFWWISETDGIFLPDALFFLI